MRYDSLRWLRFLFPFLLLGLFLAIYGLMNWHQFTAPCHPEGDHALTALSTLRVFSDVVYAGPYSRLGVRHPSPVIFYLLGLVSFPFRFVVSTQAALHIAAFVINMSWCCLLIAMISRAVSSRLAVGSFVVLLMALLLCTDPAVFHDTWGPSLVILPMLVFICAAVFCSMGRRDGLFIATLSAVYVSGTHVGTIAVVAPVYLLSLLMFYFEERPARYDVLVVALIVSGAFGLPLLHLYIHGSESHIYALIEYILDAEPSYTLAETYQYIGGFYRAALRRYLPLPSPSYCLSIVLFAMLVFRPADRFHRRLRVFTIVSILCSVIAACNLDSLRLRYVMWWHMGLVTFALYYILYHSTIFLIMMLPPLKRVPVLIPALGLLIALFFILPSYSSNSRECTDIYEKILERIPSEKGTLKTVSIKDRKRWKVAAASVLALYEADNSVCVYEWDFMFEDSLQCNYLKPRIAYDSSFRLSFFTHTTKRRSSAKTFLIHRKADIAMVYERPPSGN